MLPSRQSLLVYALFLLTIWTYLFWPDKNKISLSSSFDSSAPQCVAGSEDSTQTAENLNKLLGISTDESSDDILSLYLKAKSETEGQFCQACSIATTLPKNSIQFVSSLVLGNLGIPSKIKRTCIEASMQREIQTPAYQCASANSRARRVSADSCISDQMVDFTHWLTNSAIDCLSTPTNPIDARIIFSKFNNESGFRPFYSYRGGHGIGQLVDIAIRDVQLRGQNILESIANSNKPSCAPFKNVVQKKIKSPRGGGKLCEWISFEEGMARNIIYALSLFTLYRDQEIKPLLARYKINDPEFINFLTMVAYGRHGPLGAKRFFQRAPRLMRSNVASFSNYAAKKQPYIREIRNKLKEALKKVDPERSNFSEFELRGDSCVEW